MSPIHSANLWEHLSTTRAPADRVQLVRFSRDWVTTRLHRSARFQLAIGRPDAGLPLLLLPDGATPDDPRATLAPKTAQPCLAWWLTHPQPAGVTAFFRRLCPSALGIIADIPHMQLDMMRLSTIGRYRLLLKQHSLLALLLAWRHVTDDGPDLAASLRHGTLRDLLDWAVGKPRNHMSPRLLGRFHIANPTPQRVSGILDIAQSRSLCRILQHAAVIPEGLLDMLVPADADAMAAARYLACHNGQLLDADAIDAVFVDCLRAHHELGTTHPQHAKSCGAMLRLWFRGHALRLEQPGTNGKSSAAARIRLPAFPHPTPNGIHQLTTVAQLEQESAVMSNCAKTLAYRAATGKGWLFAVYMRGHRCTLSLRQVWGDVVLDQLESSINRPAPPIVHTAIHKWLTDINATAN